MSRKVRKAIIPAAGLGTRFLPATKTVPKEMLPIVDRPIILHIVEEAARSGIEDIVIIAGRNKTAIEDFFDVSYELEDKLGRDGRADWIADLQRIRSLANVISIRQQQPLGLGHAVLCGKPVVGDEPFAVLLGDEIMITKESEPTVIEMLAKSLESTGLSTVAAMQVDVSETSKYGIVEGEALQTGGRDFDGALESALQDGYEMMRVRKVIEKPNPGQTQSRWALPGRYVFSAEIYRYLENLAPGRNGEIQLSDAMNALAEGAPDGPGSRSRNGSGAAGSGRGAGLLASSFHARRYDAGDKFGFLQANIEIALDRPVLGPQLREYLKALAQRL